MKNCLLLFLLLCTSFGFGQSRSYDYAYTNKKGIYVYSMADKKEYFVAKDGDGPCISPDGKKLLYTVNAGENRFIRIVDLNTMAKSTLNTHSNNCYGASWSSDEKMIVYNVYINNQWHIAVINADNKGEPKLTNISTDGSFSPVWAGNNRLLINNMDDLKVLVTNVAGNTLSTYTMKDMEGNIPELKGMIGNSSGDKFILTNDNKKIVISCGVDPGSGDGDGPPNNVFVYDIATKKTLRLSPKEYDTDGLFVKGNTVFFAAYRGKSSVGNVYSVDVDGRNFKLLFPGCLDISAKN